MVKKKKRDLWGRGMKTQIWIETNADKLPDTHQVKWIKTESIRLETDTETVRKT